MSRNNTPYPNASRRLWSTSLGFLALGISESALAEGVPEKRATPPEHNALTLDSTEVTGEQHGGYKKDVSSSPKFTAPLRETPKSVTIITDTLMQERGVTSLADALRTTPGITFGAGEGGTPLGDRPFIRGYEASTDILIDGIRDVGRLSHETFNVEQVEIVKGPGSAYAGRGSTGGTINLVSKTARAEDFTQGSLRLGTDQLRRTTVDINRYLPEQNMAFRLNAMKHEADTPGRDDVEVSRWGIAPTLTFGLHTPTRLTLSYYHMQSDDIPDQGHPMSEITKKPVNVDRDNFYGFAKRDFRKTSSDLATFQLEHDLNEHMTLRNTLRGSRSMQDYIMSRASLTAAQEQAGIVARGPARGRNVVNKALINQTDLFGKFDTGSITHSYSTGVEFSRERLDTKARYAASRDIDAGDLNHPNPNDPYAPYGRGDGSHSEVKHNNRALYLMDTLALHEQWDLNLGVRYDDYHVSDAKLTNKNNLWNYQAGIVFKPLPYGSIYLSYGTSSNPSGETAGQSGGADGPAGGGLLDLDPEKSRSLELGTKWDLLDERLALTAAIFKTEKTDGRSYDPTTGEVSLTGNSEVQGFEVGATGSITDRWDIAAGYTYLDAKTVKYANSRESFDGKQAKFIAPHSGSVWTTYMLTERWKVGGGANYMSKRYVDDANIKSLDAYWRYDAMVAYRVNKNLDLQFNVLNLTDETIYDASHVGVFANVAPGRSAELAANFRF